MPKTNKRPNGKQQKINGLETPDPTQINTVHTQCHRQRFNRAGYAALPLSTARVGIIGLSNQGPGHLKTLVQIKGGEIKRICDKNPQKVEATLKHLEHFDHSPALYTDGED